MPFSETAKNEMLDGTTVDLIQLHDGDPGAAGTNNAVSGREACVFASASGAERVLDDNVDFGGLSPNEDVTWVSIWEDDTADVFKGRGQITSGDTQANAAGEYRLTTGTKITIVDP